MIPCFTSLYEFRQTFGKDLKDKGLCRERMYIRIKNVWQICSLVRGGFCMMLLILGMS